MSSSVDFAQQSDRRSSACTTSKDDLGFTVKPSTITRGDLQKMKIESSVRKNDEKIKYYVNYIKDKIITNNENGDIKYCYNFNVISNKESDYIIKEIIARLQNIFVDMEIKFYKANGVTDTHISFDWSGG